MISHKRTLRILYLIILVLISTQTTQAKSVYDINDTETSKLEAYKIEEANLVWQTNYDFVSQTWGPVGIAIDESVYGQFLFITFENENDIELVNAKTMEYVGTVEAPDPYGTLDLAGIVVDNGRKMLD